MAHKGKVFVGAAGNGGPHAPAGYPAAYAEVIAVTAVDGKGGNWDHANRGAYIDGVEVGMIDTLVDGNHRFFAGSQIKSINLALKQDAPPAPHWHATGVLSVMAGLPNSTAHLTEALAYLDEKTDVQIVNMSPVGPQDELVHARIVGLELTVRRLANRLPAPSLAVAAPTRIIGVPSNCAGLADPRLPWP